MRKRGRETCERYIDRLPLTCPQEGNWPANQACALTGNRTKLLILRLALNPLSQGWQAFHLDPEGGKIHSGLTGPREGIWAHPSHITKHNEPMGSQSRVERGGA